MKPGIPSCAETATVTSSACEGNPKDRAGKLKPSLSLIPPSALIEEALAMRLGAQKYGPYNWRDQPIQAHIYIDAAMRHILSWFDGEDADPESGASHLGHARACLGIIVDGMATGKLIDDRPASGVAGALIRTKTLKEPTNE